MLWDGQTEITESRAKTMIEQERRSSDFFDFIRQMMRAAAEQGQGCRMISDCGSPYAQVTDHDEFTAFIFERVENENAAKIAAQ